MMIRHRVLPERTQPEHDQKYCMFHDQHLPSRCFSIFSVHVRDIRKSSPRTGSKNDEYAHDADIKELLLQRVNCALRSRHKVISFWPSVPVTTIRSSVRIGDERPKGISRLQSRFLFGPNSTGNPVAFATPLPLGPRKRFQSSAQPVAAIISMTVNNGFVILSSLACLEF